MLSSLYILSGILLAPDRSHALQLFRDVLWWRTTFTEMITNRQMRCVGAQNTGVLRGTSLLRRLSQTPWQIGLFHFPFPWRLITTERMRPLNTSGRNSSNSTEGKQFCMCRMEWHPYGRWMSISCRTSALSSLCTTLGHRVTYRDPRRGETAAWAPQVA